MNRRYEYEKLMDDTYTVYVESSLASPLAGCIPVEIKPRDTVREIVTNFLFSLEKEDGILGLAVRDKEYNKLDWGSTAESQGIKEGTKLYVVYDKASLFRPIHFSVIGFAVIFIAAVLLIVTSVLFSFTGGDIPFDYGIVIDAGSTHSGVFLYQWSGSKYQGTGEVFQRDFCQIEGGIAEGSDPSNLVSCVNNVTQSLSKDVTSPVVLYLGATAGMRLLNISNPLDAHLILTAIKYALKTTAVKEGAIEIIQGQDEGIFSWVTSNFLCKTLNQDNVNITYGALDLGGGSTQVVYALNTENLQNMSDIKVLKLYGLKYYVMSKSFLCFGLSEALNRSEAILFMSNRKETIYDPCLPKNYSVMIKSKEFFEKPCIKNNNLTQWLETNPGVKDINIVGGSDYEGCVQTVKRLANPSMCTNMGFSQCLEFIDAAHQQRKFMAFSSFHYVVNYLTPNGSLTEFLRGTKSFCSLSYDQIKTKVRYPGELSHLLQYCFGAVYIAELLTSNYGFNSSTWKNIIFQQSIKGADIGWSLGFMINATNAIPEELPRPPVITLGAFVPLVIISCLMFFFAAVLLNRNFKCNQQREREALLESIS